MEYEYEAKSLICKSQFEKLITTLDIVGIKSQENNYLDTEDGFFRQNSSALRIRNIDDQYIFSLKMKTANGAKEWNSPLTKLQYNQLLEQKSIDLRHFDCPFDNYLPSLRLITIVTKRYVCKYQNQLIELDHTHFNQVQDFEVEVEANSIDEANHILNQLLNEFEVKYKKSYPKIARYYMYN